MSLFRFGFTRKSDREEFQAAQELNPTEPGDERKAETDVSTGKCKRIRKYQSSWERDFPWLGYDKEKNTMKCRLCRSFPEIADKTSSLYIGTSGFRRTTIQAHAKSKSHFKCFEANSAKENPAAAPMGIALRNMNAQVKEKLRTITLQDGSSITITRRHKLLTNKGWKNHLKPGDYVAVPANNSSANLRASLSVPLRLKNTTPLTPEANIAIKEKPLFSKQISYCKIQSIEDIDYQGWVYDFEVEEHHNFIANNIICHNTVQFIAFLLHLKEEEALEKPTLLVCPTSVLGNWEREVKNLLPTSKFCSITVINVRRGKHFKLLSKTKIL